mmetsp:Transcript_27218/g.68424  ORF Transcript_27218/g.68424 Transcript_27218/m.68424 type:complete len:131 (+) Transcript_27218:1118-1510(+)
MTWHQPHITWAVRVWSRQQRQGLAAAVYNLSRWACLLFKRHMLLIMLRAAALMPKVRLRIQVGHFLWAMWKTMAPGHPLQELMHMSILGGASLQAMRNVQWVEFYRGLRVHNLRHQPHNRQHRPKAARPA